MKSSTDRFAGGEDEDGIGNGAPTRASNEMGSDDGAAAKPLPPWKQAKRKAKFAQKATEVEVVVAAPPAVTVAVPESKPVISEEEGFKSATPSTFKGDRGGTAEVSTVYPFSNRLYFKQN